MPRFNNPFVVGCKGCGGIEDRGIQPGYGLVIGSITLQDKPIGATI
jgi:hypothetical protein